MNSAFRVSLALLTLSLGFVACQKKSDPAPSPSDLDTLIATEWPEFRAPDFTTLLTFKAHEGLGANQAEGWIFASDEDGNVLDIKQFEKGKTVILTSDKVTSDQKVIITVFQNNQYLPNSGFTSFLGVATGQKWTSYVPIYAAYNLISDVPAKSFVGTFTLNVKNYPAGLSYFQVTSNDEVLHPNGPRSVASYSLYSNTPTKILVSSVRNDVPVYMTLTATPGQVYSIDFFTDLKPMNHILSYGPTPGTFYDMDLYASEKPLISEGPVVIEPGHRITYDGSPNFTTGPYERLVTGWPDGFAAYFTLARMSVPPHILNYYCKIGAGPESTPFLTITSTIANNDIRNFTFTAPGDYHTRHAFWRHSPSYLYWHVSGPPNALQKLPDIPQELISKYAALSNSMTWSYVGIDFTKHLDGFSYEDFLQVVGSAKPGSREFQLSTNF